ncbi:hypothetical protein SHKM778_66540 [Streptomyces sp. KM77-8]|uniref:Phospholipid/glycerol acyltransferase domain-containing protein n=1 Tax=Streptomyces haneummycinicus TaxID=3074435 RepID=A0AAT9HSH9_9ACTN
MTDVPTERGAEVGRRIGVGLMYGLFRPRVLGAWRVPATGPVIFAVNHSHNIDGPMVMGVAPRPTHFLIKKEAFIGPLDPFLTGIGQLKVDRDTTDRTAISRALGVLRQGGVLGIFPEGTRGEGDFASLRAGLAYFAVRGGAPIVPVAVLGSSGRPGRLIKALPRCAPAWTSSSATPSKRATEAADVRARRWTRRPNASRSSSPRTWKTPGASPGAERHSSSGPPRTGAVHRSPR